MGTNYCGGCTLCCKLAAVDELDKPHNVWCKHCAQGEGCTIYDDRPEVCQGWHCMWLMAVEAGADHTNPILRPDHIHVVMRPTEFEGQQALKVLVDPDHPDAWEEPLVVNIIKRAHAQGMVALIVSADETRISYP